MHILVINSGSSSVKYGVYEMSGERVSEHDVVDLGERESEREAAIRRILETVQTQHRIDAVGHRVVHGGDAFR